MSDEGSFDKGQPQPGSEIKDGKIHQRGQDNRNNVEEYRQP